MPFFLLRTPSCCGSSVPQGFRLLHYGLSTILRVLLPPHNPGTTPCSPFVHWRTGRGEETAYIHLTHGPEITHLTSVHIPAARIQSYGNTWLPQGLGHVVFILGSHVGRLKCLFPQEEGRMHFMIQLEASATPSS